MNDPVAGGRDRRSATARPGVPPVMAALAGIALIGIVLVLLRLAAPVAGPIMLALFLAALAAPGLAWLQGKGVRRGLALAVIVLIGAVGGLLLIGLGLVAVARLQAGLAEYGIALDGREAEARAVVGVPSDLMAGALSGALGAIVRALAGVLADLLFSVVLTAFLLLEAGRFGAAIRAAGSERPFLSQAPDVAVAVVRYFAVRTRLNLITGAGVAALLWALGIDYWPLWGVVTFFLSYIPYIGLTLALIPPALLGWAEFGLPMALLIVALIVVGNLAVENILEPTMTSRALDLSPTVVFVSFFFWTWLLGPAGMLMSMPITVLIMLTLASDPRTRWVARFIGRRRDVAGEAPTADGPTGGR